MSEIARITAANANPPLAPVDADGKPQTTDPAAELSALLGLPSVGVHITSARWFGQGAAASIDLELSNGETMQFASVRDMVRPQGLIAELVACAGATPTLKQPQAVHAVKLARAIAERTAGATEDDLSTDWGVEYLQAAETLDIDLDDQAQKWAAFERLSRRDPWGHAREHGCTYAAATIVLRAHTGERLVRAEWFMRHVRGFTARETPTTLAARMMRVGWERRGTRGRIKATAPGRNATLAWAFWIVPAAW